MSVSVSLTGLDAQTVLCIRTSVCRCRPEVQMQLDELPVLMHELDLVRLADLSGDVPIERRCTFCGRSTAADYRVAAVVPEERSSRALVHARRGGEQAYALIDHGDSSGSEAAAAAIFQNFPDPARRQEVAADEEELVRRWGRPLSTHALFRVHFAKFLTSGKAARMIGWSEAAAYLFARRHEDDLPQLDDVANAIAPNWGAPPEALLAFPAEEARGHTGSLLECLGPARTGLRTAEITCLANTIVFGRLTEEAFADSGLAWEAIETGSGARIFRASLGEVEAELSVADVARSALLYGRTPTEAATLEVRRLGLKLATTRITKRMLEQPVS